MTRQTSIEAYHKIEAEGLLSKRRWEVFRVLFHHGPLTAGEIGTHMPHYRSAVSTADRNIHARLSELRDFGCVRERGEAPCPITGMTVILWDVTDQLPIKSQEEIQPTRRELINALCLLLEEILPCVTQNSEKGIVLVDKTNKALKACHKHRIKK